MMISLLEPQSNGVGTCTNAALANVDMTPKMPKAYRKRVPKHGIIIEQF